MMTKEMYEEKRQAKIDYAISRSRVLRSSCNKVFERGFGENVTGIPFGQPILVGHHSERRHRNAIKRMDNQIRKALDDGNKADYYLEKAKRMEDNTVISSDDPSAINLLKDKLSKLESNRELIKAQNKQLKSEGKDTNPHYVLSNLAQNIRSVKLRIEQLEKLSNKESKEYVLNGVTIKENTDENRLQLIFDGIPEVKLRDTLKSNGFKWSRFNGCWQRQLTENAIYSMKRFVLEV